MVYAMSYALVSVEKTGKMFGKKIRAGSFLASIYRRIMLTVANYILQAASVIYVSNILICKETDEDPYSYRYIRARCHHTTVNHSKHFCMVGYPLQQESLIFFQAVWLKYPVALVLH